MPNADAVPEAPHPYKLVLKVGPVTIQSGGQAGVMSFNGRKGDVLLKTSDVEALADPLYLPIVSAETPPEPAKTGTLWVEPVAGRSEPQRDYYTRAEVDALLEQLFLEFRSRS